MKKDKKKYVQQLCSRSRAGEVKSLTTPSTKTPPSDSRVSLTEWGIVQMQKQKRKKKEK
jgi:hypothetical protein